uniref:Doublesex- and mab-3-related transcription factor C1/C2 C-terminal domain-containing protein n=1 Tax=Myotis lucifugus TaxID=59463 RepID=G1Q1V8_MYOLU
IFVSVLDSSTLEEATDNFSFQKFPQSPCPSMFPQLLTRPRFFASSEWWQKLEAAEALLILRESPQALSDSISQLQP